MLVASNSAHFPSISFKVSRFRHRQQMSMPAAMPSPTYHWAPALRPSCTPPRHVAHIALNASTRQYRTALRQDRFPSAFERWVLIGLYLPEVTGSRCDMLNYPMKRFSISGV
jgi:hypothetical protein